MRQIIIDTETTGLDPRQGHRIIELAALEMVDRRRTGRSVHFHVDPEREIDKGASEVHGMTWDDLRGKPKFRDIVDEFVGIAQGAEWVIHNAPFDVAFLDAEFALAGRPSCASVYARLTDTLLLAREIFPGKRNSLDALCERFGVDHAHRTTHGALLDAHLLTDVWLAMTRGQDSLSIDLPAARAAPMADPVDAGANPARSRRIRITAPTSAEQALHAEYLARLDQESSGRCVWLAAIPAGDPAGIPDAIPAAA